MSIIDVVTFDGGVVGQPQTDLTEDGVYADGVHGTGINLFVGEAAAYTPAVTSGDPWSVSFYWMSNVSITSSAIRIAKFTNSGGSWGTLVRAHSDGTFQVTIGNTLEEDSGVSWAADTIYRIDGQFDGTNVTWRIYDEAGVVLHEFNPLVSAVVPERFSFGGGGGPGNTDSIFDTLRIADTAEWFPNYVAATYIRPYPTPNLVVGQDRAASLFVGKHSAELVSAGFNRRLSAQDLRTRSWKMAHRGGSLWRPEMTRKAYLDAALTGADVLEFSVGRTSDGVYFGLHDETIDRTTDGSGKASELTWGEVNSYLVNVPSWPGIDPQPHYRLEDFIKDFQDTHVLMIDPKYVWVDGHSVEFYNFLLSHTTPDRVVMKFSFGGSAFPNQARSYGFISWGYDFGGDPSQIQNWELVGLDINLDASVWSTMLAEGNRLGVPLTAFILNNADDAQLGAERGARSFQCSRPDIIHLRDIQPTPVITKDPEPVEYVGPIVVATTRINEGGSTPSISLAKPGDVVDDDVVLLQVTGDGSFAAWSGPTGWVSKERGAATNLGYQLWEYTVNGSGPWVLSDPVANPVHRSLAVWVRGASDIFWGDVGVRVGSSNSIGVPGLDVLPQDLVLLLAADRTTGDEAGPTDIPQSFGFDYVDHTQGDQAAGDYSGISSPAILKKECVIPETIPLTTVTWPDSSGNAYGVMVRLRP